MQNNPEDIERIRVLEEFGRAEGGGNFWHSPRAIRISNDPHSDVEELMDAVKSPRKD